MLSPGQSRDGSEKRMTRHPAARLYCVKIKANQLLNITWMDGKPGWLAVIGLGLIIAVIAGCGSTSASQDSDESEGAAGFDCEYNPVGIGSWGPGNDLSDFRDSDLLVKAEVTGHHPRTDIRLLNELKVLKVLKGDVTPGDQIFASSGGGVCLPNGEEFYLYLTGPADSTLVSVDNSIGDSTELRQLDVYYIVHPFAQFPITAGRVDIYEGFLTPYHHSDLPSQFDGLPEEDLEIELRQAIE